MGFGMYINSTLLFGLALEAYQRTQVAWSDRAPDQLDAVAAVILSVAALEGFINDAVLLAESTLVDGGVPEPDAVRRFHDLVEEVEKSQGSLAMKYLWASTALTGMPFEKGRPPYQHFKLLVDLRNELIHYKPQEKRELVDPVQGTIRLTRAPILRKLEPLQILAIHPAEARHLRPTAGEAAPEVDVSWLWRISTRATAKWACNSAAAMVHAIKEMVPIGRFSFLLEGPVRAFQTIP